MLSECRLFVTFIPLFHENSTMNTLADLERYASTLDRSERMPVLFVGHGNPMNAIRENSFTRGFQKAAQLLPSKPSAVLCVSAHWYIRDTRVTAMSSPKTIHDFYRFPKELNEVLYPAPGSPELAAETAGLLKPVGHVELDHDWGLDHGTWSVIKHLFPEADVPVIQLSIDATKPAQFHMDLAKQLQPLRDKGILIVGSGNIVHNLRLVEWKMGEVDEFGFDWAHEVRDEVNKLLEERRFDELLRYQEKGSAWQTAIPTPDHYLPLLYSMGPVTSKDEMYFFNDQLTMGSLSMTSILIS